ncbi:MAG: hypothetical protein LUE17_16385 [Planctomycetaceae bacterium]|nr:hypothetical protein [Planctomycetaceae bacterium]
MSHNRQDDDQESAPALLQAIRELEKNRQSADAFFAGKALLEHSPRSDGLLAGCIRNAHEAGLLDECAAFLIACAEKHPDDAELLNYTAGLLGGMGRSRESRDFAIKAAARRPFFPATKKNARMHVLAMQCIATGDYRYSPLSARFYFPGITDLYTLLDPIIAVHRLLVDDLPAALDAATNLPHCDIVLNTISDPDYAEALHNAAVLCDSLGLPVFNPPQ